jgi:hypothetical protein
MEQVVYDRRSGQNLTGSFIDYCIPRADAMPYHGDLLAPGADNA